MPAELTGTRYTLFVIISLFLIVQVHLLSSERLLDPPLLLRPREHKVEYYVDHAHDQFYVFTNWGPEREYKVSIVRMQHISCSLISSMVPVLEGKEEECTNNQ